MLFSQIGNLVEFSQTTKRKLACGPGWNFFERLDVFSLSKKKRQFFQIMLKTSYRYHIVMAFHVVQKFVQLRKIGHELVTNIPGTRFNWKCLGNESQWNIWLWKDIFCKRKDGRKDWRGVEQKQFSRCRGCRARNCGQGGICWWGQREWR